MTVWCPVMFRDELDMLTCRLETTGGQVQTVLVEAPETHRGVAKPLHYREHVAGFEGWSERILHVVADLSGVSEPWAKEHVQRNSAWSAINILAKPDDVVIIGDLDEIPSPALLAWDGPGDVASVRMRTTLFAVDWEVPQYLIPPTCVVAKVGWLRERAAEGMGLAQVRDARDRWPVIGNGGWHFSWIGGPERQKQKLLTATCHTELLNTIEGDLIATGERYRTSENGGGLPVVPVDVDETWPQWIRDRNCPAEWFRPR